jgi:O-antigen/teichoic acid export membrane protein
MIGSRFRPILLLLSGNFIGAAVGGTFFLVASQRFSLEQMGRYAVAISFQWVAFGLIGTGLAISTLRIARDRLALDDRAGAAGVVASATIAASLLTVIAAIASYAFLVFFGAALGIDPLLGVLAVLWAGARALLDCIRSGLLAQQDFRRTALLTSASAATGLAALVIAVSAEELTVIRLLGAHTTGLFFGALVSIPLLAPLGRGRMRRDSTRAMLEYARWPSLSEGTRLLQSNLGAPLLVGLAGPVQAGLFGLGRYPAYVFDVVIVSLYQFWLARAVGVPDRTSMRGYVGRQLRWAGGLGLAMIAGAVLTLPIIPILGPDFARARPLFILSAIDFAIVVMIRPIETAFHGLSRPRLELIQRGIGLPILIIAALVLVPRWGAIGMAGAHLVASLTTLAFGALLLRNALAVGPRE